MKPHRVITYTLPGNRNYLCHAIEVSGVRIHSQIGPYGAGEVEERIRAHLSPPPPVPMARFIPAKRGPKPKGSRPATNESEDA